MAFPGSLPSYIGFTASHTLSQDQHASQHNQEQSDIIALATKLGIGGSTPSTNTVLRGNGAGTTTYDQLHLATDVSGVLPVTNGGTGGSSQSTAQSNLDVYSTEQVTALVNSSILTAKEALFPVGCIYTETTGVNPATTFGFGSWSGFGGGRVLMGVGNNGTTNYATPGATGGQETTNHGFYGPGINSGNMQDTGSNYTAAAATQLNSFLTAGGSSSINDVSFVQAVGGTVRTNSTTNIEVHTPEYTAPNLQPYIIVYFWERVA